MTLVVDASVVLARVLAGGSLAALGDDELIAPPMMWSETRSVLHETKWRGEVEVAPAATALATLDSMPVVARSPRELGRESWRIADELGWAKTYDAEYVALALLEGCRLVTLDERLRRGTARLGFVVGPLEL